MFHLFSKKSISGESSRDPVCGMRARKEIIFVYKEHAYAFCSTHCRQQFEADPEKYMKNDYAA